MDVEGLHWVGGEDSVLLAPGDGGGPICSSPDGAASSNSEVLSSSSESMIALAGGFMESLRTFFERVRMFVGGTSTCVILEKKV